MRAPLKMPRLKPAPAALLNKVLMLAALLQLKALQQAALNNPAAVLPPLLTNLEKVNTF